MTNQQVIRDLNWSVKIPARKAANYPDKNYLLNNAT